MHNIAAAAAILAAYLLGGIPFGLVLGKLRGVDIRKVGSGNIGATNLTRALGRRWGVAAFLLDFGKGLAPVLAARLLGSTLTAPPVTSVHVQIACGLAAILGHVFSPYLRWKGGKGVATAFGVMAALVPLGALAAAATWGLAYLAFRTVSIASILAAVVFPIATCLLTLQQAPRDFWPLAALSILVAALILARHRENIQRLLQGKEHRF